MTLPRILYSVPHLPHVRWEIAKAIQTLGESLTKAAVDDPKHPGWPAHTPDDMGGQFRPKDFAFDSASAIPATDPGNAQPPNVQVAMEPTIDPATGGSFLLETPLDRLGGGEGPEAEAFLDVPAADQPKRQSMPARRVQVRGKSVDSHRPTT